MFFYCLTIQVDERESTNDYAVMSSSIEDVWKKLNPVSGLNIAYTCSVYKYRSDDKSFIVQIEINGEEILSYKEGKEALLYYINNYY